MAKILKSIDYYKLVTFIYSMAEYNKGKAIILFNYVAYHLIHSKYNELYIEKLALDLKLLNDDGTDIIKFDKTSAAYSSNLKYMDKSFNSFELINIKAAVWDILHKGYYE